MKEMLDKISALSGVAIKLVIATGALIIFSYCFFHIHYFPAGLSIGDSLVFIFAAIGFGIFYFFWISLGLCGAYCLAYPFFEKMSKADRTRYVTILPGLIFISFLWVFWYLTRDLMAAAAPLIGGVIILVGMYFWHPKKDEADEKKTQELKVSRNALFAIGILLPLVFAASTIMLLINASMINIGLAKKNVSLVLSKENYAALSDVASEFDVPLFGCEGKATDSANIIHNVNLLWHGIGDKTLVEIPLSKRLGNESFVRMELDAKGVQVIELMSKNNVKNNTFKSCLSLKGDTIFDTYTSEPNKAGAEQLNQISKKISSYIKTSELKVNSIKITGYTDQSTVHKSGDSNISLSQRRAESVYRALSVLLNGVSKENIQVLGLGSLNQKSKCSNDLKATELTECRSVDRRVEIELVFSTIGANRSKK